MMERNRENFTLSVKKKCGKFLYTLIIALLNKLLATEIKRFLVLVTHYEKVTVSQILFSHSEAVLNMYTNHIIFVFIF